LLARSSAVLIPLALAGSVGSAVAQYVPQQPPPGYPPQALYSHPASPQRYPGAYDYGNAEPPESYPPPASYPYPPYDTEAEDSLPDSYPYPPYRRAEAPDDYPPPAPYSYPAGPRRYPGTYDSSDAQPSESYPPPASYPYPHGPPRYPGAYPYSAPPLQDRGTVVAALPPEYQPERGPIDLSPRFYRTVVDYPTVEPPGTIIIDTPNTYLYLTIGHGKAIRYGIGVGREGFTWSGTEHISRMKEWPDWLPPTEMIKRQPYLPRFMAGGETNPLGARAMYLGNTVYRIHGTNQPSTIGSFVSSGCIRLTNEDVEDLYSRVTVGTTVIVLPGANTAASQLRSK
jgi:lipoprotein-anchoring transpeptidase ErfK/SrfK